VIISDATFTIKLVGECNDDVVERMVAAS